MPRSSDIFIIILVYLYFSVFTDNITERQNKLFLSFFALQKVYTLCPDISSKIGCKLLYSCLTSSNGGRTISSGLLLLLNNLIAVSTLLFKSRNKLIFRNVSFHSAHRFVRLNASKTMVFHILVYIKRIEFLAVKTGKEHSDDQTKIKRFHVPSFSYAG